MSIFQCVVPSEQSTLLGWRRAACQSIKILRLANHHLQLVLDYFTAEPLAPHRIVVLDQFPSQHPRLAR